MLCVKLLKKEDFEKNCADVADEGRFLDLLGGKDAPKTVGRAGVGYHGDKEK